jgi:phosphopantothenoylcysteine decarboxylase/phosphopantothenate--cysteine ligase
MEHSLHGRGVLITAGPTWVPLDAIRHLGNFSSGSLGLFLARRAAASGASVTLLLGPGRALPLPADRRIIEIIDFITFDDLQRLVRHHLASGRHEAMLHTAAVADYRPVSVEPAKVPSGAAEWVIRLVPTPKIVDEVRGLAPEILLVKFKLEVGREREELIRIAAASRERSQADLILANDLASFAPGRHPAILMDAHGVLAETGTREELADRLLGEIARRLRNRADGSRAAVEVIPAA